LTQRDSDGEPRYRADIHYEYSAPGGKHFGDRVLCYYRWGFDGHSYNQAAENGVVLRYPVGREVRVHYDPAEPEESVLEPGQVLSELVCGLVALGIMALATLLLLLVVLGRVRVWRVRQRAHELASLAGAR
jgi:hypothetical protein